MIADSIQGNATPFAAGLRQFLRDFSSFAGRRGIAAAILVAMGAVLEACSLILIVPLLSIAIGSELSSGRIGKAAAVAFQFLGVENSVTRLALLLGIFSVLILVRAVVISMRDVAVAELQTGFVEAQRLRIAERLAAAQWNQVVRLRHARITHLMSGDIQRIGTMTNLLLQNAVSSAMLLAQFALVFFLAPFFASLAVGILVLGGLVFLPVFRRARILGWFLIDANLSLLDSTTQFLGGLKLAISQNLQTRFIEEFRRSLNELTRRQIEYIRQQSRVRIALSTLSALAAGLLVLFGFGAFHLAPATLIALVVIITRMIGPVGQIQHGAQQLAHVLPAYEKAKELEHELATIPHERAVQTDALLLPDGKITFEDVSFRHAADNSDGGAVRGLRGVNLTIESGEFIGITGPSGAGKTTLADLLVGLFSPQEGRIAVAGTVLEGPVLAAWRDRVSYISQDPFLFHDTFRRNLVWANPLASEKAMWDALALAGADELVRSTKSGLDSVVGERGTLLSGGERQRVALARAILRKPRLLVLDEATSAIDIQGERKIFERLRELTPHPTIVVVAHRVESLALCERVFRLEAGRCVGELGQMRHAG